MGTRARGKATPEDVAERDAAERETIEHELAMRDVFIRIREVATSLERVRLWVSGRLRESLTGGDLLALDDAAKHYRRLTEKLQRRIGA